MRTRNMATFAIVALVIGATTYLLVGNRAATNLDDLDSSWIPTSVDEQSVATGSEDSTRRALYGSGHENGSRRVPHPFPDLPRSRRGLELGDDPFVAESSEEQAWLDRNGYPNSAQLQTLMNANDVELHQAAMAGDSVAKAILDGRRLAAGEFDAINELLLAAADGSLFALELLAAAFSGASAAKDPVTAYALTRVVEMKGNSRIGAGRDLMFSQPLSPVERLEAEAQAQQLLRVINDARQKRKGPGARLVDARPVDFDGG